MRAFKRHLSPKRKKQKMRRKMPFSSRETNISQEERGELAVGKNEAIPFLSTAIRWSRRNTHRHIYQHLQTNNLQ